MTKEQKKMIEHANRTCWKLAIPTADALEAQIRAETRGIDRGKKQTNRKRGRIGKGRDHIPDQDREREQRDL